MPRSQCRIAFLLPLWFFRTSLASSFNVFAWPGNTRDSEVNDVAWCRGSNQAYLGMTKRRCLGSLTIELPIHLRRSWTCRCQPWPPFFLHPHLTLQLPFPLGVASLPYLLARPFFSTLEKAPNPHLLHPRLDLLVAQNQHPSPWYHYFHKTHCWICII